MSSNKIKLQKAKPQMSRLGNVDISSPNKSAEWKFQRQHKLLNIILNSLTHPFLIVDVNDYTIRKFNLTASSDDLAPGTTCHQLRYGRSKPCHEDSHICPIREIKKTKKPVAVEHIHYDKNGNFKNVEVRGFPILNDTGDVIEIIEYYLDVTERKQTEEKLKEAYSIINRSSSIAFTWKNMKGWPVEFVTDNVEKLFGYSAEEFLSGAVSYSKCIHPDDLQRVANEVEIFSKEDGRTEFVHEPYRIITRDGSIRIIKDWTFITRNNQGQITHYKGIVEDITERKQAEMAIKAEKDRAQNYLDIAGVMFSVVETDETISLMNKKGHEILGYDKDELIGKNWFDTLVPEKSREEIRGVFSKLMAGDIELVEFYENILLTKNGKEKLIAFHNTVIRDIDGKISANLFSAEDITERKQMELKLQKRTYDLGKRVKELGCLYSISKLIQNPDYSYDDILQGVIEIIPLSMQYPEITCARLTIENEEIKTNNFIETKWQISSKILISEKEIGLLEIGYFEERLKSNKGLFLKEEKALIDAITERLGRYIERKRAEDTLNLTNEKLTIEQNALKEKNITLREVLNQIENEKQQIAIRMQSNVDRVVIPILNKLEEKISSKNKTYVTLLLNSLSDITHPFINNMESRFSKLTPREIEVCNMVKNGLSTKEIASNLNTSVGTVFNQRKTIRKKLGIANDNTNLSSFLHTS